MDRERSGRKLVCGIGVNDADYAVGTYSGGKPVMCHFYRHWTDMLRRCYSLKYQQEKPTYKGCSVCEDWRIFTNFRAWMEAQNWDGNQLDKDLLVRGNKIYSPETCLFIPARINSLLNARGAARGKLPIGVSKKGKRFQALCNNGAKYICLGTFDTPKEAHETYLKFKSKVVENVAKEYSHDKRLHDALIRISGQIKSGEYFIA